jgi:hypothetical protein
MDARDALETASARIKGDKDRENPVERPQPVAWLYDFVGFRAAYVRKHDDLAKKGYTETPLYAAPLETTPDISNDTYAFFMAERDDQLRMLTELAHQYLSDMRYPPSADSKERRIARIEQVLKEVEL